MISQLIPSINKMIICKTQSRRSHMALVTSNCHSLFILTGSWPPMRSRLKLPKCQAMKPAMTTCCIVALWLWLALLYLFKDGTFGACTKLFLSCHSCWPTTRPTLLFFECLIFSFYSVYPLKSPSLFHQSNGWTHTSSGIHSVLPKMVLLSKYVLI